MPGADARGVTSRPLAPAECRRLLGRSGVGRVAFTDRAMPAIAAVPYRVVDDEVVLAVPTGSRLADAMHDAVVAFGVDDLARGWTVTVVGEARRTGHVPDDSGVRLVALTMDWLEGTTTADYGAAS